MLTCSNITSKIYHHFKTAFISFTLASATPTVMADTSSGILDCPLRDAPFSIDTPLIDIMLSPKAVAVLEKNIPGLTKNLPPFMASTEAPSIGAILSVRTLSPMMKIPTETLIQVNHNLSNIQLTNADRRARCARYDNDQPSFDLSKNGTNILIFQKINGFDHGPSVSAAANAITALAEQLGWTVVTTNKGGAINTKTLAKFNAVVWNNVSGDVLTLTQRKALEKYINNGGGFLGIHGSGGDPNYVWDWYADELLGARFIGHPMEPQFQQARINIEKTSDAIGNPLSPSWTMKDEWYSFMKSPRLSGSTVVATLDESTYQPTGQGGQDLRMGKDHPIVWNRCVGQGRSVYTAIGHRPESYHIPEHLTLLRNSLVWAAGKGNTTCPK